MKKHLLRIAPLALFLSATFAISAPPAQAQKSACGEIKVSGYTATRVKTVAGKRVRSKVWENRQFEKELYASGEYYIRNKKTRRVYQVIPKKKTVISTVPKNKFGYAKTKKDLKGFVKEAKGSVRTVILGMKLNGKDVKLAEVKCNSQGIILSSIFYTPGQPNKKVTMRQTNIKIKKIPNSVFKFDKSFKVIKK